MAKASVAADSAWIIGCGDVGCRLSLRLLDDGISATGWCRRPTSRERLEHLGLSAACLDLDDPVPALPQPPDWLFYLAPPPTAGRHDARLRAFLAALPGPPQRLIYVSTSGVYGDCQGRWIDEAEPLKPAHDRARRRVDAEHLVTEYAAATGCRSIILRVPGIYGPGRLPLQRLRCGRPLPVPEESPWSNRVHAEDLAALARLAAMHAPAGAVYNAADGRPSTMTDYLLRCCAVLEVAPPPLQPLPRVLAEASPMQRELLGESKRLRNQRARRELGWAPRAMPDALAECVTPDLIASSDLRR